MPCITCASWIPPERAPHAKRGSKDAAGHCNLDQQLSHAYYHCPRHTSASAYRETLSLTDDEITWLRANRDAPAAQQLIEMYHMVETCPQDPGARGLFAAMLEKWRARHTGEETLRALAKQTD